MLLRTLLAVLAVSVGCGTAAAGGITVKVSNPGDTQRQQLVELPTAGLRDSLHIGNDAPLTVRNALGQTVATQLTYDGQLLFEVAVRPHSSTTFTVEAGQTEANTPSAIPVPQQQSWVYGAYYPNRADDLTWENDRGAFRAYGPALQRSGERAFGYDVWSKTTPALVVDHRYQQHMYGENLRWAFHKVGQRAASDDIVRATSFHYDHGQGLDAYAVGPTLGCGAPALILGDSLVPSYCWQQHEILDNGPLRFTVRLTFGPMNIDGQQLTEHRTISLDKGSHFNRCVLWYEGQERPITVAAGVVVHKADKESLVMDSHSVLYADPTDRPQQLGHQVYVGVLFPTVEMQTRLVPAAMTAAPRAIQGTQLKIPAEVEGNAVGIKTLPAHSMFYYLFGSAWSGYDVTSFAQWQQKAQEMLLHEAMPLNISIND